MTRVSTQEIKAAAIASVRAIADELAPDMATLDGHRRWSLNPTRRDTAPNSFCVDVAGPAPGRFMEFASGESGDVIDFVSYCLGGSANYQSKERRGQAIRWLKAYLGFEDMSPGDREVMRKLAKARDERAEQMQHAAKAERNRKAGAAKDMWLAAQPWSETSVQTYLEQARGLPVAELGSPLNAIRYAPEAACGVTGEIFEAMMTAFTNARGEIRGVHTTFLAESGTGKADIERSKRFFGDCRGCAMRLHRGASGLGDIEADRKGLRGDVLAVGEGIENALSWAFLFPQHRVWAAGSIDMIASIPLPACVSEVIVLRDNDAPGSAADAALDRVMDKLRERMEGRRLRLQPPPRQHKDMNDYWRSL